MKTALRVCTYLYPRSDSPYVIVIEPAQVGGYYYVSNVSDGIESYLGMSTAENLGEVIFGEMEER